MTQAALLQRTQTLLTLHEPDALLAHGLPFSSEHKARWAYRTREDKGLSAAFIRIGKNIYIDPDKFHELARNPELTRKPQPAGKKQRRAAGR